MAPTTSSLPSTSRGAILLVLALATLLPCLALPKYLRAKNSAEWPRAAGVITSSHLVTGSFKQMKGYRGVINYRYQVGSAEYSGSRLSFGRDHLAVRDAWQKVLDAYPAGKTVDVYYDPKDPSFAILEPGLPGEMALLYKMDLFFIATFAAALLIALFKFREPANP
jgi:Protein of unknown function (DUF3592)